MKSGHDVPSFVDDFYDRIHLIPTGIALGNLVSNTERTFAIWNAWRVQRTLSAVLVSGNDGLVIDGFPNPPYNYGPMAYVNYTLQASTDGPPNIVAEYRFQFSHGEESVLDVTGQRILVFPFRPNWTNGMIETLEWKSDVLRSFDGSEQRRALRIHPRRGFEYDFMATKRDTQRLEALLWGWGYRDFALPVWTDGTALQLGVNVGDQGLLCDTTDLSFRAGDFVVLFKNSGEFEAVQVGSFDPGQIYLQFPLQTSWEAGTKIYPAVIAHLPSSTPLQRYTDSVLTGRVAFSTSADQTYAYLPTEAASVTYDGLEVVTVKPNWKDPIQNEFTRQLLVADTGVGPIGYYTSETYPRIVRPFQWFLTNRAEIRAFRAFLGRMRGQVKTCWVPSWHSDFTIIKRVEITDTSITVLGSEFSDLVGLDTNRNRLMIMLNDGTIYYRQILGTSLDAGNTVLGLSSNFGRVIEISEVKRIQFLLKCRLASDKVEIPWRTNRVATPQVTFTTVKA